jgi:hypothetical protein
VPLKYRSTGFYVNNVKYLFILEYVEKVKHTKILIKKGEYFGTIICDSWLPNTDLIIDFNVIKEHNKKTLSLHLRNNNQGFQDIQNEMKKKYKDSNTFSDWRIIGVICVICLIVVFIIYKY